MKVGVDIVSVKRFDRWPHFSEARLRKIFSEEELRDCRLGDGHELLYRSEGLAVRFAAKEAFFKAWCSLIVEMSHQEHSPPFFSVCKAVSVTRGRWGVPSLSVDWQKLALVSGVSFDSDNQEVSVSLSHEREHAIAIIYLHSQV